MIKTILKAEGLFIFLLSVFAFSKVNGNWFLFVILLFAPDISMLGYTQNAKTGAVIYNLIHNYALASILILSGFILQNEFLQSVGLILAAHIGLDRTLGFGLKEPTGFKDTHIGK